MNIILIVILVIIVIYVAMNANEHMSPNITDYISEMPTFIINLKDRPDRKARAVRELNKHKIKGTFIEAINGIDLEIDGVRMDQIYVKDSKFRLLRKGEIGCYLSHMACWNLILESGNPYGLVLEDDVVFVNDFKNIFNDAFSQIKDMDWDIIALGRRCNKQIFDEDCVSGEIIYKNTFYPSFIGYATYAYIIKASTIDKLLKTTFPFSKPIDVVLIDEQQKGNIKIISFMENLAGVNSLRDSDTVAIV